MTYKEALEVKRNTEDFYDERDKITYKAVIVPLTKKDFDRFINDYRSMNYTDEACINYSSDNKYSAYLIWTDGINVLGRSPI